MTTLDIDFEWFKYSNGYEFDDYRSPKLLKPKAGALQSYWPFERGDGFALLGAFARIKDRDDLLTFYSVHGPLTGGTIVIKPPLKADSAQISSGPNGESVADAMAAARQFSLMLANKDKTRAIRSFLGQRVSPLKIASARLYCDRDGKIALRLKPQSLLHALRLFAALKLTDATALRSCRQCGQMFAAGPGQQRDAKSVYCSPKCQKDYNNVRRKTARS